MKKIVITKIMRAEMSPERIAHYVARCELSHELHLMRMAIYAKYNPTINELKAQKMAELQDVTNYECAQTKQIDQRYKFNHG